SSSSTAAAWSSRAVRRGAARCASRCRAGPGGTRHERREGHGMSKAPNVLVIDDDPDVVSWIVESLVEEGFRASGETSARRALERLRAEAADLVISDVEMPEM